MQITLEEWGTIAQIAGDLATAAGFLFLVVTAVVCMFQLRTMNRSHELGASLAVLEYFDDLDFRRTRWFAYENAGHLKEMFLCDVSAESRAVANARISELSKGTIDLSTFERTVNAVNNIAFLINQRYVPPPLLTDMMRQTIARCYSVFEPYILWRRGGIKDNWLTGAEPLYCQDLSNLAERVRTHSGHPVSLLERFHAGAKQLKTFLKESSATAQLRGSRQSQPSFSPAPASLTEADYVSREPPA